MKRWWLPTTHLPPHILTICGSTQKYYYRHFMIIYVNQEGLVATHHTFTTTYFDNMWDNMWVHFFLGKKLINIFDITQKYSKGYFTCMQHFSCRWYRPPVFDLNGYPRISNPNCRDIQIRRCEWTQSKKMTQSKLQIKNSKLFYMYAALLLQVVQTPRS